MYIYYTCTEERYTQITVEDFLNAYSGHLCYLWFQFSHAKNRTVWP